CVVIEKELLDLRERLLRPCDLLHDVANAARAIAMAADGLRPQAEGATRLAAASGVERDVRMLEITNEVVLDPEVALVALRHEWQRVHILQRGTRRIVHDASICAAVRESGYRAPIPAFRDFLDGEVEFITGDEID